MKVKDHARPTEAQIAEHIAAWGEPEDSTWECPQGHMHRTAQAARVHGGAKGHHSEAWLTHVVEAWALWHREGFDRMASRGTESRAMEVTTT